MTLGEMLEPILDVPVDELAKKAVHALINVATDPEIQATFSDLVHKIVEVGVK